MKYIFFLIFCFAMQRGIVSAAERDGFSVQNDVAQYKGSDYANVVQVARSISLDEAFDIAEGNPDIDYFVYMKGWQMVLEIPRDVSFDRSRDPFGLVYNRDYLSDCGKVEKGYCRIFSHGDVVFFKKEGLWLGSAPGLADAYFKDKNM
jgi:hypothetical protein